MPTFILDARTIQDHFPGIGRYAFRLACALAEFFPDDRFRLLHDAAAQNTRFNLAPLFAYTNVQRVNVRAKFFSIPEQGLALTSELMAQANAWHSPYYALPLRLSIPSVVTLADLTPLVLAGEMPSALKRLIYRTLNYTAARRAQEVITFSSASRLDLERVLGIPHSKIFVVPLAADETFSPAPASQIERVRAALQLPQNYVLYVGSNKPHKNLARLIEGWAKVETNAVLVISGAWDSRYSQVKEMSARWSLDKRVLFRPGIAENDLPALMSGAQLFVFPSVHEGFGLPPLEAMACGVPVACANASSLPEVVGEAAYLFDPFNVQDIADALSNALNDVNLRLGLRERGLQQAKKFSWERVARETMRVYLQSIDRKERG